MNALATAGGVTISAPAAIIFTILVLITLGVTYWASQRNKSVESHLVAKGAVSGRANGVAIAGDFISAATVLGTTGAIALSGFNGFYYAVYIPISFLLALLLIAEPLRNLGHFTLGDVLATRFRGDGVRGSIAISSIVISLVYMVAQFVGAATLIKALFGLSYFWAALVIGLLTIVYTLAGGMVATTYIQIIKTTVLLFAGFLLLFLVLNKFGWNPMDIFTKVSEIPAAKAKDGSVIATLTEPLRAGTAAQWEQFSLIFGVTLGVLGLPHVLVRFLTVKDSSAARTSAVSSIWIFAVFLITLPIISYGARLLVAKEKFVPVIDPVTKAIDPKKSGSVVGSGGNLALPELSKALGGDFLFAFVSAVVFATILAALSGLVIATTGAISHDIYGKLLRKGIVDHKQQLKVARIATFSVAVVAMLIALLVEGQNVAFLATLAIAIAASATLPALLLTMYWRKTTATGVTWGMVAGLVTAVGLILVSPSISPTGYLVPLKSPGVISIPIGFIVMILMSLATQPKGEAKVEADQLFDRIRFQATTGIDPGDPDSVPPAQRVAAH